MPKLSKDWYKTEQGVVVPRCKKDDKAAEFIVEGLDHGWELLSHNVISESWLMVWFFVGRLFHQSTHVLTFSKRPA